VWCVANRARGQHGALACAPILVTQCTIIINWKFYFINVFFNPLAAKDIYYMLQKVVSQNWYSAQQRFANEE